MQALLAAPVAGGPHPQRQHPVVDSRPVGEAGLSPVNRSLLRKAPATPFCAWHEFRITMAMVETTDALAGTLRRHRVTLHMGSGRSALRRSTAVAVFTLALAGCGDLPETGTEVTPPVPLSPTAGEIPEETFQATAVITDEGLDPDRFAGRIGDAFELVIESDGTEHTLVIEEMVADTPIAAEGSTTVAFTIAGEPGMSDILLDGEVAGQFERQIAGGLTDT